jgi:hypothetical protein
MLGNAWFEPTVTSKKSFPYVAGLEAAEATSTATV